jgi:hypothetical protein
VMAISLTIILISGNVMGIYMDSLANIVLVAWAEVATANAFYMNKAKAENKIKIAKSITDEEADRIQKIVNIF